ncbi:MAG: nicotinate-nucleotide--dimethylbenzimidazole phosphoribosyltransferase, partial [Candidatus Omnitrophica bacterium]|nr:nicotinate-nucleotide--dimethylbenzimidazole phosphoribosyltransferase [Candidatus Omnitrophota bacterium]
EFRKGVDIACLGEMGIGNTTSSSAITAVFTGKPIAAITGKGTGIGDKALLKKMAVIEEAIRINRPDKGDPIDVLSKVGGFEIAGLAGVVLAAASKRVPVVIDGFISAAAALIAYKIQPIAKDYMIASHSSVEKGHRIILDELGIEPIIDLNLRLGEGTGAALVLPIIEAAVKILSEMATFESAKVSEKNA